MSAKEDEEFPLHKAVFQNDQTRLAEVIEGLPEVDISIKSLDIRHHPINELDNQGNTALTVAVLLALDECAQILIEAGANCTANNADGWTAFDECVSTSNRMILKEMYISHQRKSNAKLARRKPELYKVLTETPDFYVEIHWDFSSWIPFVSRFCPSDLVKIWKHGYLIRMDITLLDFVNLKCKRGNVSFLFDASFEEEIKQLTILNHEKRTLTSLNTDAVYKEEEADHDVEYIIQSETVQTSANSDALKFDQRKTYWKGEPKQEFISEHKCSIFDIGNLEWEVHSRNEHFTNDLLQASQAAKLKNQLEEAKRNNGNLDTLEEKHPVAPITTLKKVEFPPYVPPKDITFEQYFDKSQQVQLGKVRTVKVNKRTQKAVVWLAEEFPITVHQILPILEIMAPSNEHLAKLGEFIKLKMPTIGFPIQLELPVYHVLTGIARFDNFKFMEFAEEDEIFAHPKDYENFEAKSFADISAHHFDA